MYVVLREFHYLDGVNMVELLLLMAHVAQQIENMQEVLQLQIINILPAI